MTTETRHGSVRVSATSVLTIKASDPASPAAIDTAIISFCSALALPLRLQILRAIMDLGESSPMQVARMLEESLTTVSRHVRALNLLGAIVLKRTVPRRGTVQHYYDLAPQMRLGLPILLKIGGRLAKETAECEAATAPTGALT